MVFFHFKLARIFLVSYTIFPKIISVFIAFVSLFISLLFTHNWNDSLSHQPRVMISVVMLFDTAAFETRFISLQLPANNILA